MDKESRNQQTRSQQAGGQQAGGREAGRQQAGGQYGGGRQQQQYDAGEGGQFAAQIQDRMEVIGADGARIGRLDTLEGNRLHFLRDDIEPLSRPEGAQEAWLPLDKVRAIEGGKLHLKIAAAEFSHTVACD